MDNILLGRSIRIETSVRCDYCHRPIEVGKHATQVTQGQALGLYHGRLCYESALADYMEKKKEFDLEESSE